MSAIEYNCEFCGVKCITTTENLRYRQHYRDKHYCQKCIIKLTKQSAVFNAMPSEYHADIFAGVIEYSVAKQYLIDVHTNLKVKFVCACGRNCEIRWNKLRERLHNKFEDICYYCLQSRINNDPHKLKQHIIRSQELWKNDDYRARCISSFVEHNHRMQTDVKYAHKNKRKSRSVSGNVKVGDQIIEFDSGFELIFIDYILNICKILKRCEFAIPYGNRYYHPDFYVVYHNGKSSIIEIKGHYRNRVKSKQKAAIEYITSTGVADEYVLYDTNKLLQDGILIGLGGAKMWKQIRRIKNERIVSFTNEEHYRIAEIGPARYYKEKKNSKNIS